MRVVLILVFLFTLLPTAFAESGRYQAVVIPEAGRAGQNASLNSRVLILDTVEGHLWIWGENETIYDKNGKPRFGTALTYQGRVRPGSKVGEIIEMIIEK